jgi:hypothetical protein
MSLDVRYASFAVLVCRSGTLAIGSKQGLHGVPNQVSTKIVSGLRPLCAATRRSPLRWRTPEPPDGLRVAKNSVSYRYTARA